MAPFYGWVSTASRLEPLKACSLLFTTKYKIQNTQRLLLDPEINHYEPEKTVSTFNNNYIQYESIGDKDKSLSI